MKNFFKLVSISALAAAVYGVPVANANTATPEACVANDLTLTFDLTAIDTACRGETYCSRLVMRAIKAFLADMNVSVGQSVTTPYGPTFWPFVYTLNGVDYQPGQAITIPATTESTITAQVKLKSDFASMRTIVMGNGSGSYLTIGLAFFDADNAVVGTNSLIYSDTGRKLVDMTANIGPIFANEVGRTLISMGYTPEVIESYITPSMANQTFRGFVNSETVPNSVSTDATPLAATYPFGIGIGEMGNDGFYFGKNLTTSMTYSENAQPYMLYPAFAQNCDAETTVTACDTSNPTKPICELSVGPMGEVTYNNGCCTGYSLPDATTTE